jgi:hypothetical protein
MVFDPSVNEQIRRAFSFFIGVATRRIEDGIDATPPTASVPLVECRAFQSLQ